MNIHVTNHNLSVGKIDVIAIASSSAILIGDTDSIQLASLYDTPLESLLLGPFVPLAPE
ncbi:hypothetical protein [Bacillus kwashiorkori]|uniref:hypothetical protein n=1 Tax=Bacillus kwashiorkori TaxID=1522318 RepID=UPI000783D7BA|nr:hypothetical protein [Bacillus kwashiorkori]